MGMSASQARLLSITARINDVEFKSQSISNTKIRLADESEQVSKAYTEALNKTKMVYTQYDAYGNQQKLDVNSTNLTTITIPNPDFDEDQPESETNPKTLPRFQVIDMSTGQPVTLWSQSNQNGMKFSGAQLYEMIESGQYMLQENKNHVDENGHTVFGFTDVTVSGNTQLAIEADTVELAKAEADYNAATAKINKKEKLLDNELKALDTEHSALTTERDSIKTLVGDNIKSTFELFS